ncbi:MAG TPA: hypothetical protein VM187_12720, partial [Niastella sp.]|nr:hypothetical protein [Niastella sp.]
LTFPFVLQAQLQPIGVWRDHLPYQEVTGVTCTTDKIWAVTPYSLFSLDPADNSIERWSKTNGLAETGISGIAADPTGKRIVIGYNNSNIDVLVDDKLTNINALKNANIAGDKSIQAIYIHKQLAYVATGMGIIVINLDKYEIKDTYVIGAGGTNIKVNSITSDGTSLFAATAEGVKKAPLNNANLADFRNWQMVSGSNGSPAGNVQSLTSMRNKILALRNDSLWLISGGSWSLFYRDGYNIKNCTVSNNTILLSETNNNTGRVVALTATGSIDKTIQDVQLTRSPKQAIFFQNEYWIADTLAGLSNYSGTAFNRLTPDAPLSLATGGMQILQNTLWVAAGSVNNNWEPLNNKNGLFSLSHNTWNYFNGARFSVLDTLPDIVAVAIDPTNESVWAGSFGGGLANIKKDNSITIFKQNSALQPAYFNST